MNPALRAARALPELPRLPPAMPRSGVSREARLALRQVLGDNERALAQAFHDGGHEGREVAALVRLRALAVAAVVVHAWRAFVGDGGECALLAVGGFGRGVLFPQSDVDLLVLGEPPALADRARALEGFFACLWDVGLKPGHAVRTLDECRVLGSQDLSVYTALLDARLLAGDHALADALAAWVVDPGGWSPQAFLEAKRAEQAARHARYDDTAYNLEPNLKDGPGGLRTLDLMRWLGRRVAEAGDFQAMVRAGLLERTECEALQRCQAVLWRCRYGLHLVAGRPEERLLFDYQRRLASAFGYHDEHATNLAVEQFMQGYYRAATIAERLGVQLLERCAERLEPDAGPARELDRDFVAHGQRIEPRRADLFLRRPRAMVEVFALQLDHPGLRGLSAGTMRGLQQALARSGGRFAQDAQVLDAFVSLLRRGAPAVDALARMNRHGVLAAILPAFRRVVGRMQYDLFHAYTVDEHTMRVLRNVARFADPEAREAFPLASETFATLDRPDLLLLAALFHDIAKGRGGDHSELGEHEARAFCERAGLPPADTNLVAWLVRWHLLMSVTAQRQDITDPDVVHRFALQVGDRERLDQLYLLTVADIAGTNPKLWNDWKARLLGDLHMAARYALRAGIAQPEHADERAAECRRRALELLEEHGLAPERAAALLARFPAASFLRHRPVQLCWQALAIARAGDAAVVVAVEPRAARGGSELFVCAPDRDGLFAAITATLDRLGFGVVGARLLVAPDGRVFHAFGLLDAGATLSAERASELEAQLRRVLASRDLVARIARRSLPRRLRHFQRPPQIEFTDLEGSTQLALVCSDRPGLLAEVAQALHEARVRVHAARIATFGERVEDFFVLTNENDAVLAGPTRDHLRSRLFERLGPGA